MFRPLVLTAAVAMAAPLPARAQEIPTLWDFLRPERIIQRAIQSAIMAARTQVDIKYGDMAVNPITGQVSISDLTIWPLPEWDDGLDCVVSADRAVLSTAAIDETGRYRLRLQLHGLEAGAICLPPEPRGGLAMAGLQDLSLPRATFDLDYDVASAGAVLHVYALVEDYAAIDLTAEFDYLWFDGREDMDEPIPVVFLTHAALTVENLGGWSAISAQLPPPFADPAGAGGLVEATLGSVLADANRDSAELGDPDEKGPEGGGDPSRLTDAQRAFVTSAGAAWTRFLENPAKLVLETTIDPDEPAFVDFEYYEDNPQAVFDDLQPRVVLASVAARQLLPGSLIAQATGENAAALSDDDRRRVGLALVKGTGAPRNVETGLGLLSPLADAGDGAAALALSEVLELRDPEAAYRWALRAGAAGEPGATARLDRLEGQIAFPRVLALQNETTGAGSYPLAALERVATIRAKAAESLSGNGELRSYRSAALWAILATAAGDREAALVLDDLDRMVRLAGPEARAAWANEEKIAADLAVQVWISEDLAARFSAE